MKFSFDKLPARGGISALAETLATTVRDQLTASAKTQLARLATDRSKFAELCFRVALDNPEVRSPIIAAAKQDPKAYAEWVRAREARH